MHSLVSGARKRWLENSFRGAPKIYGRTRLVRLSLCVVHSLASDIRYRKTPYNQRRSILHVYRVRARVYRCDVFTAVGRLFAIASSIVTMKSLIYATSALAVSVAAQVTPATSKACQDIKAKLSTKVQEKGLFSRAYRTELGNFWNGGYESYHLLLRCC